MELIIKYKKLISFILSFTLTVLSNITISSLIQESVNSSNIYLRVSFYLFEFMVTYLMFLSIFNIFIKIKKEGFSKFSCKSFIKNFENLFCIFYLFLAALTIIGGVVIGSFFVFIVSVILSLFVPFLYINFIINIFYLNSIGMSYSYQLFISTIFILLFINILFFNILDSYILDKFIFFKKSKFVSFLISFNYILLFVLFLYSIYNFLYGFGGFGLF